jgi:hypothetical protein
MVPYARLAGVDGMRLSRATFAVMIKFSEFFQNFIDLVDEVDITWSTLEGDADREIKMKEEVKKFELFDQISKRWESASKMRQWINEKKKNMMDKVKKEVETEYVANKKLEQKKKDDLKEKADKLAEEKKVAEEKKNPAAEEKKEAPVEVLEQIDTSIKKEEAVVAAAVEEPSGDAQGLTE